MKLHILLAEDNLGDVLLVQQALDEYRVDAELHIVRDGAEALEFVARMGCPDVPCPQVLLLDLNLPKVDGPDVLREFRRRPECQRTPVVVISSSDSPRDRARTAELGISRYFKKPSELNAFLQLGAVVREVVNENYQVA